jgi:CRISPR-associated protein Cmr1
MRPGKAAQELDPQALRQEVESRISNSAASWRRYTCKLVTPMVGGGVSAGEIDRDMPIRATAIRGQLRFWWRLLNRNRSDLLRADQKPDSGKLFAAERAIWGGLGDEKTLAASQVTVLVETGPVAVRPSPKDVSPLGKMILADSGAVVDWLPCNRPFEFIVSLRIGAGEESVLQAFRMWASFGGIGARRRRGLGAMEVFDAHGERVFAHKADRDAAKCVLYVMSGAGFDDYRKALEAGVKCLIDFRQKPGLARGLGQGSRPGGSYWPEANAVRNLTKRARPDNIHALGKATPLLFPRALLGLPIVFQFKLHERLGDPFSSTLEVADDGETARDRFASPLIFSAWSQTRGSRTIYQPVVLLLPTHNALRKLALKLKIAPSTTIPIAAGSWWPLDARVRRPVIPKALRALGGEKSDALLAFLQYFQQGGDQ